MDLVIYLIALIMIGFVNVFRHDGFTLESTPYAEVSEVEIERLEVGNNLDGVYHKNAFMKIIKELGLG